jgi:hypothetical protein
MGQPKNNGRDPGLSGSKFVADNRGQENGSIDGQGFGAETLFSDGVSGTNANEGAGSNVRRALPGAVRSGAKGFGKLLDAGEFGVRTAGNMANTLGGLVADASGNRIGPERNFSLPQFPGNKQNRSSRRATGYVIYQDSQN